MKLVMMLDVALVQLCGGKKRSMSDMAIYRQLTVVPNSRLLSKYAAEESENLLLTSSLLRDTLLRGA
jgi:hypothetical protein